MSSTTAIAGEVPRARRTHNSLHRQRAWALWGSYIALAVFVVIFLVPPFYTLMTSLKTSAEIGAESGSPWIVHHPTFENFWYLITYPNFQERVASPTPTPMIFRIAAKLVAPVRCKAHGDTLLPVPLLPESRELVFHGVNLPERRA